MIFSAIAALFASLCGAAHAQTISGRVVAAGGEPVVGCAVIVQTVDSVYVAAGLTDAAGAFAVAADVRPFLLLAQHVSYLPHAARYDVGEVGTVTLAENPHAIEGIVVTGQKPLFTLEEGKISYDVGVLTQGRVVNTAYDVLTELPGVSEQGGAIALSGSSSLTVILNGRKTTMSTEQLYSLLRTMPASRVARAEVMYSVPPRYRVRGAAINLVLAEADGGDLQGEVYSGYTDRYYGSVAEGATLLFATPRLTLDAAYSFSEGRDMKSIDLTADHTVGDEAHHIVQNQRLSNDWRTHNLRAGVDYQINERNRLSAAYTAALSPRADGTTAATGTFADALSDKRGDDGMHNAAVDFTSDAGVELGADFTHYTMASRQAMSSAVQSFVAASRQKTDVVSVYAGRTHTLDRGWGLNYGASFDHTRSLDSQRYSSETGDMSLLDTESALREYTYDLYAGFSKQTAGGTSLSASLTAEHYRRGGLKRWDVFPQFSLQHVFSADHIVQAGLSSDKIYPAYWQMQQYVSYLDGYSEIHGNPTLTPARTYQATLLYYLKQKYMVQLFYIAQPGYFQQSAYQLPDRLALLYQMLNWDYYHRLGMNVIVPFKVGRAVDSRLTLTGLNMKVRTDDFHGTAVDRDKWLGRVQLDNSVKLSARPSISLDITGYYQSPAIQCTYDMEASWGVDAGLKWLMLKDRMTLSVNCTDLFSSTVPTVWAGDAARNFRMASGRFNRGVEARLSWRFGKFEAKERRKVDTSRLGH